MAVRIPFIPSTNNYRLRVPLLNQLFLFDVYWNDQDGGAWMFNVREEDETLILAGQKIVINGRIGIASTHPLFKTLMFTVIDTANSDVDAKFDDLGTRIHVLLSDGSETS